MLLHDKTVISLAPESDVPSIVVHRGSAGVVVLCVNDRDSDDSADGAPLVTGVATSAQAVKLARALLAAAGVDVGRANICGWNNL